MSDMLTKKTNESNPKKPKPFSLEEIKKILN